MKRLSLGLLLLCTLAVASSCARVSIVHGSDGTLSTLGEMVSVSVNCTSSKVVVNSFVASGNTSLVGFPSGVNLTDSNLLNVTGLWVSFSTSNSSLIYAFNGTNANTARSMADAVTPTLGSAFQTTFAFVSTGTSDGVVNVTYSGAGKSNITQYTQSLMTNDLYSGLGGVASTFLPMSLQANAVTAMAGTKDVGAFNWICEMLVSYSTNIGVSSGNHTVDILSLLGVNSLAPSSYTSISGYFGSEVGISVVNGTVTFATSSPGQAGMPNRGWTISSGTDSLTGLFYFGPDASAVSSLTFTFSGTVISEFPATALIFSLMIVATMVMMSRKRVREIKA